MGIQEIKEEILSRKLREIAKDLRHTDPLISETFMNLSIKNYFLSEIWEYSNSVEMGALSDHVRSVICSFKIKDIYDLEDNFNSVITELVQWIRDTFHKDK